MRTKYKAIIYLTLIALAVCGLWYVKNTRVTSIVVYKHENVATTTIFYGSNFEVASSASSSLLTLDTNFAQNATSTQWKIYKNEVDGFQFEYPGYLFVAKSYFNGQDQIQNTPKYIISASSQRYPVDPTTYVNDGYFFYVTVNNYDKPFDFNRWFNTANPDSSLESLDSIKVDGQVAYEYTVVSSKNRTMPKVLIPYNKKNYSIEGAIECNKKCSSISDEEARAAYDHILVTFKFINK